jgi:two-component system sensor histidine kinase PilS (NtrC family)
MDKKSEKRHPDLRETLRWAILLRVVILSAILLPGMMILYGPESHFLSVRLLFFYVMALVFSLLEYAHSRRGGSIAFQVYSHLFTDLVLISSVVDATGAVGSQFSFLYVLLILEAGIVLKRGGALMWATVSSLVYLLLGILRFWGEGPLFGEIEERGLLAMGTSNHPLFDVFLPLTLFYLVAFIIGFISSKLDRAGERAATLGRELRRLSLESMDVLYNIPTGVLTCDLAQRLVFANPAAMKLLELDGRESIGYPIQAIFSKRHHPFRDLIGRTVREMTPVNRCELAVVGPQEDEVTYLGVSTSLLRDVNGEILGATAIFQDITHLKRFEEMSRTTVRLNALTELSASVAHEIKNPLATINSSLELLEKNVSPEEQRRLLKMAKKESERLTKLLGDFLRLARIQVRAWKEVDLRQLIEEVKLMLMVRPEMVSAANIQVKGVRGKKGQVVWGDPELLKQVFLNLFINAVEAMSDRGSVRVTLRDSSDRARLGDIVEEGFCGVTVEDDGPGFSAENVRRAFEPFFTTKAEGNGLGLTIVRRIVEAHGGRIDLVEREAKGALFSMILPQERPGSRGRPAGSDAVKEVTSVR